MLPLFHTKQMSEGDTDAMGYRSPPSSLRKVVSALIADGDVEYSIPGSPTAPNQRLRLKRDGEGHS